ncbi:hypothetical protein KAS14_05890 [Candidatus Bathyarchaeota archaeon]|nr:hypothetical protein [Candidatus Bathyarchaeota archaeon]
MYKKLVFSLLFLLLVFSPNRVYAYTSHSLKNEGTLLPSLAVVLENGTSAITNIGANGTTANITATAIMSIQDYGDNDVSDVDSSADKGTHGNFSAQQYGPDLINDTLIEGETDGGSLLLYVDTDDETRTDWMRIGTNPYLNANDYSSNYVNVSGNKMVIGDFGFEDSGRSTEDITSVTVQLYVRQSSPNRDLELFVWDGLSWTSLGTQITPMAWGWLNWTATTTLSTWTKIDGAKIYFKTTSAAGLYEVDSARLTIYYASNYELDLEVQWTNVNYNKTNEYLCFRTGTLGSENLKVDAWNGSGWEIVTSDLQSNQWNNFSVSDLLASTDFTLRFKGSNESSDVNKDSWNIDVTLLHVWTNGSTYDYVLSVVSQKNYHQNISLNLYDSTNIERLTNCTVWFHDSTTSVQIEIIDGSLISSTGDWYNLTAFGESRIALYAEESNFGTSILYIKLEAVKGNSIIYENLIKMIIN